MNICFTSGRMPRGNLLSAWRQTAAVVWLRRFPAAAGAAATEKEGQAHLAMSEVRHELPWLLPQGMHTGKLELGSRWKS